MSFSRISFILALIVFIQTGLGILAAASLLDVMYNKRVAHGVQVGNVPLGGMNSAEAGQKLEETLPSPADAKIIISGSGDGRHHEISLYGLEGKYNHSQNIERALSTARQDGYASRLLQQLRLRGKPQNLEPAISFAPDKLDVLLDELRERWEEKPVNARVVFEDNTVGISPGKDGYELDPAQAYAQVRSALENGKLTVSNVGAVISPLVTTDSLSDIDALLGEYVTTYNEADENRIHNLTLACHSLDGTLLQPREAFSLNKALGPRLQENGYRKAPVIINSELVNDVGGGICQVATTLFNAVLLADLEITQRAPHSRPVSYVEPGLDATIAEGIDFSFVNSTDKPIYISSRCENNELVVQIFGNKEQRRGAVKIYSEKNLIEPRVIIKKDESLPAGQRIVQKQGSPGYKVNVYRQRSMKGEFQDKELIYQDYYQPIDQIVITGPDNNIK